MCVFGVVSENRLFKQMFKPKMWPPTRIPIFYCLISILDGAAPTFESSCPNKSQVFMIKSPFVCWSHHQNPKTNHYISSTFLIIKALFFFMTNHFLRVPVKSPNSSPKQITARLDETRLRTRWCPQTRAVRWFITR